MDEGLVIMGSIPGSPAARMGIRRGDRLIIVNGERVKSFDDFARAKKLKADTVELVLIRNHEMIELVLDVSDGKSKHATEDSEENTTSTVVTSAPPSSSVN